MNHKKDIIYLLIIMAFGSVCAFFVIARAERVYSQVFIVPQYSDK